MALIEKEYLQDPVCESLSQVILNEWLDNICDCDPAVFPFFQVRRELIIQGHLFLLGSRLFFPSALRKEITSLAHSSHIGLGGCLRRLQECMFRPRMNSQMKDFVGQCDVGLTHRDSQVREPILQRDVSQRLWAKVAAELCHFPGRKVLGRTSRGTWTQGICLKEVSPRSYDIRVHREVRRRNRIEMWLTIEQPLEDVAVYFTPLPLAEPMVPSIPVSTPSTLPSVAEPTPTPELSPNPM